MAIATLSIDLEAKLARLEGDLGRANRMIEQASGKMERNFSKAGNALKGLAGVLSADLAVRWMVDFVRITADGLDKLNDLSDATGASVENLSALEDIAARTGTSLEVAGSALVKFNKGLSDAKPGSETAAIFERLGLSVTELRRLDPAEAMLKTAQALATFADDGAKARDIQIMFGKSVKEAAPFLKDLAEKGQLNASVTTAQAEAAEKFNKQMFNLQKNAQDFGRTLMSDLLPYMTDYLEKVTRLQKIGWTTMFGQEVGSEVAGLKVASVVREIESVTEALKTHPEDGMLSKRLVQLRGEYTQLSQAAAAANEKLKLTLGVPASEANPLDKRLSAGLMGAGKKSLGDRAAKVAGGETSEVDKYIKRLEDAQIAALDLTNTEKAVIDIAMGKIPGLSAATEQYILDLAEGLDSLKRLSSALASPQEAFRASELALNEAVNKALDDEKLARYNDQRERLNRLLEATPTMQLQKQREDVMALEEALRKGLISETLFNEAMDARLGKLPNDLQKASNMANELGDALGNAAGDAIMNFESLDDVLANLSQQILQIIMQQTLINPLKTWAANTLIGIGVPGIKAANGAAFDGGSVIPFANGGIVNSPTLFNYSSGGERRTGMAGEAGTEAILPLARGAGGKLGVRGGGGVTINQQISIGAGVNRNEVMVAMQATKRETLAAVVDAQRRGRMVQ